MTILKWYSIVLFSFGIFGAIFKSGKTDSNIVGTLIGLLIELPILVYLILS